jgi:hypothetical protein
MRPKLKDAPRTPCTWQAESSGIVAGDDTAVRLLRCGDNQAWSHFA